MNSLSIFPSAFLLMFCTFCVASYTFGQQQVLVADYETETGEISPYLVLSQTIAMFQQTTSEMTQTVIMNTNVLNEVRDLLSEIKANFSCCCSGDQRNWQDGFPSQSIQKELDTTTPQTTSTTTELPSTTPEPKTTELPEVVKAKKRLTELQRLLRPVLVNLKQNYTFTGVLEDIGKEVLED